MNRQRRARRLSWAGCTPVLLALAACSGMPLPGENAPGEDSSPGDHRTSTDGPRLPPLRVAGSPPPPTLLQPVANTRLGGAAINFTWQAGSGTPAAEYYEFCLAETDRRCNHASAVTVGNLPPATTNYSSPQGIPLRFQGERLSWTVTACATNTQQPAVVGGTSISCTPAARRVLDWPLPAPSLTRPSGPQRSYRPNFAWTRVNGADDYLVCISRPGVACPSQTTDTPDTLVVRRSTNSYTPPDEQGLLRFAGETVHWSAAACNARFGCNYQPSVQGIGLPIRPWRLALRACTDDSACGGGDCDDGYCKRLVPDNDTLASPRACSNPYSDQPCQYGRFCAPQSGPSAVCTTKLQLGASCQQATQCVSGFCNAGQCAESPDASYMQGLAIVDQQHYAGLDADGARAAVANASDRLYEKTGHRISLREPVQFPTLPASPADVARVAHMVDQWHAIYSQGNMHTALVFAGPTPNPASELGVFGFTKPTVVAGLFCNEYAPVIRTISGGGPGEEFIPIGRMTAEQPDALHFGHIYVHELLHTHGGHMGPVCESRMGRAMAEAHMAAFLRRGAGGYVHGYDRYWEGICPSAAVFLANAPRHSACPQNLSTRQYEGEGCTTNTDCQTGFCGSPPGSSYKRCLSRNLSAGFACLSDAQCTSGMSCQALMCQPDYTGSPRALGETCESAAQCGGGLVCLPDGQAFPSSQAVCARWDQNLGQACSIHRECRSGVCDGGQCVAGNLANGQACSNLRQCDSGYCAAGQCGPANVSAGAICRVDDQCPNGTFCALTDVPQNQRRCQTLSAALGQSCYAEQNNEIWIRCDGDGVRCEKDYLPQGTTPTTSSQVVGVCVNHKVPSGSACINSADCQSDQCVKAPGEIGGRCQ